MEQEYGIFLTFEIMDWWSNGAFLKKSKSIERL
jgi:hypothetical protein